MKQYGKLKFTQVSKPINELNSKFGGQPHWIEDPEWPVSKSTGNLLTFLGQLMLSPAIFGDVKGKVAYLFMNTEEADETWNPDSGEIAVIVQPGKQNISTKQVKIGPTVEHNNENDNSSRYDLSLPCEFIIDYELQTESLDPEEIYYGAKIGGLPCWIQYDESPYEESKLLLQLDDDTAPFCINFGTGVAYAFINSKGTEGKMLWQC